MCFGCRGDRDELEPIIQQWINQDDIRQKIKYRVTYFNLYNNMAHKVDEFDSIDDIVRKLEIPRNIIERLCKSSNIYGNIRIDKVLKNKM